MEYDYSEQRKIFCNNLNHYININGKHQKEVAKAIGEKATTLNMWCTGKSMPSVGKIQKLADYFGIGKSDLTDYKTDMDLEDAYVNITMKIAMYDKRFQRIITDYYNLSMEEKNMICSFYEMFVMRERI